MPRSGFVLYTNALWYLVKTRSPAPSTINSASTSP